MDTGAMEGRVPAVSAGRAWAILAAMGFGALIAQMFSTVMSPALPAIKAELALSLSMQTWTVTAYSLAFGAALVAGGRLGDLVGEVKLIVIGFVVFGAGLLLAAIATGGPALVAGRGIQGIGIGLSAPATLSIVTNTFPIARRGFAVGLWGFAHGLGLLVGPLIAGYLLELAGWRWIFWISLPLTALVVLVTVVATRGYRSVLASGTYDIGGLLLGATGITLLTLGLQNASNGWGDPTTWGPLVVGLGLLVAFGIYETKVRHPLVDLSLWRSRIFSGAFFSESIVGFIYIPMLTFIGSLYFIGVLGMSPVTASWVIVLTTGTCMVAEPLAGRVVDRIGASLPIIASLLLQAIALIWMGTFTPETSFAQLVAPLMIMGLGVGIALPACNTAGMSAVDTEHAGMGSGLMQMTFNIPAALGLAVVTSIVGTLTLSRVEDQVAGTDYAEQGAQYSEAIELGDDKGAAAILASLPDAVQEMLRQIVVAAQSSTISLSMIVLGVVALGGAVLTAVLMGIKRMPLSHKAG